MEKPLVYLILGIGTTVGSYIPVLFGAGMFSIWSILGAFIGGIVAVWVIFHYNH